MAKKERKPWLIPAMLQMKCPSCRRGQIFVHKHIIPLLKCLQMNESCPVCGQKMQKENYVGQGMNYILILLTFFLNILWYWPIFGISPKDNSVFYFIAASTAVVILLQPFYMRLSRVLYLYFLVKYGSGPKFKDGSLSS